MILCLNKGVLLMIMVKFLKDQGTFLSKDCHNTFKTTYFSTIASAFWDWRIFLMTSRWSFFEIKIDYFFLIMITRTFLVLGTFFMITITLFNFCRGTLSKIKKSSTPTHLKNRDQETLPSNPHSQLYNKLKCILSIKKVTE